MKNKKIIIIAGAALALVAFILFLIFPQSGSHRTPSIQNTGGQKKQWEENQKLIIEAYFKRTKIKPPKYLKTELAIPPLLGLWSETAPDLKKQLWIISGDCPTDHIVTNSIITPRTCMSKFSQRWLAVSKYMKNGMQHPTIKLGDPDNPDELKQLGNLLEKRGLILKEWSEDDSKWVEK